MDRLLNCEFKPSAVKVYIAALVDLWEAQVEAGVNNFQSPRSKPVVSLLKALKDTKHAASKLAYHDRGISEYHSHFGSCICILCLLWSLPSLQTPIMMV